MDQTAVVTLSCPWTEGTEAKKGDLGEKWWRVESAGVKARGKDKRCTLAWVLLETGSWRTSPVLWLDFPWVAGGRLQVDPSPPTPFSLHTHHAEPVPVTMVTQSEPCRETEGCKQKRDPLSHFRNLQGGGTHPPPSPSDGNGSEISELSGI